MDGSACYHFFMNLSNAIRGFWTLYVLKRPCLLSHKVNIACDCRCRSCNFWKVAGTKEPETTLSTAAVKSLLEMASRAGMQNYWMWGGEPLLREDVPHLVDYALSLGFFITLTTNGSRLEERASEFDPRPRSNILITLSWDGIEKRHDRNRGKKGLFSAGLAGVSRMKDKKIPLRIWYDIHLGNMDDVEPAIRLCKELGISIYLYPSTHYPGYNDSIVLDKKSRYQIFDQIIRMKKAGYPVKNLTSHLRILRDDVQMPCRFPKINFHVDQEGNFHSCEIGHDRPLLEWGRLGEVDLATLFDSKEFKEQTDKLQSCNGCRCPGHEISSKSLFLQFPERLWTSWRYER